ncbi:MAG: replicative DNA helicase [Candidatus Edwardsbacteria bacterium]|nr:replicative DNA helicase [Candidatus Edwardsbacteria bacterium]
MPENTNLPERMPPQALEAEMAVLGSMLINPEAVGRAIEVVGEEQNLYSSGHRKIFRAMVTLFEKNQPVDLVTVAEELRRLKWLDDIGGPVYLTRLADSVATAANVEYYARIVLEKAVLRRLINSATQIASSAYDSDENAEVLLDQAEELIFAIKEKRLRKTLIPLKQFIHDSFETVERLYREKRHITGAETGFKKLDEYTSGLQGGELIIIGARPSVGKTAFALNVAQHLAIGLHQPVAIFSLEMSKEQLVLRLLCSEARVSSHKVRTGYLSQDEWPPLVNAAGLLHDAPIYIDDSAGSSPLEIRAKARRLKAEVDIKLIIVDYLQLMRGSSSRVENRQQEIAEISRSLKALAKELNVPVIALSQLSRISEQRGENSRPILSDLRESGAIEQDADVVMFLHKEKSGCQPAAAGEETGDASTLDTSPIELIIAKQRNGPIGNVKLVFMRSYTKFEDASDRDAPAGF